MKGGIKTWRLRVLDNLRVVTGVRILDPHTSRSGYSSTGLRVVILAPRGKYTDQVDIGGIVLNRSMRLCVRARATLF